MRADGVRPFSARKSVERRIVVCRDTAVPQFTITAGQRRMATTSEVKPEMRRQRSAALSGFRDAGPLGPPRPTAGSGASRGGPQRRTAAAAAEPARRVGDAATPLADPGSARPANWTESIACAISRSSFSWSGRIVWLSWPPSRSCCQWIPMRIAANRAPCGAEDRASSAIGGQFDLKLFPYLAISIADVQLGNRPDTDSRRFRRTPGQCWSPVASDPAQAAGGQPYRARRSERPLVSRSATTTTGKT